MTSVHRFERRSIVSPLFRDRVASIAGRVDDGAGRPRSLRVSAQTPERNSGASGDWVGRAEPRRGVETPAL
jgi:hypothetical protein